MMGAIVSDRAASLLNLGDVGSSYGLRSFRFVVAMSFCGLYDVFVMIGVRLVSIWCNSMLLPSLLEGIVLAQVKVKSVNAPAHSCKLMRWCRFYRSLQPVWAIADLFFVEECFSSICGFRDDKEGVGDLDTSVRYIDSDVERWLIVAKNKDEEDNDDDDDDDDDDNEEEDDDEDDGGEEGPEDEDEGEEGLEGEGNDEDDEDDEDDDDDEGNGGEGDDQDEDRDDEENGKEGDEDGEEEDGVEDEGNQGEDDDEDNDEEDEDEEPPKKKRK